MEELWNLLRLEMARSLAGRAGPRICIVSNYDPQNYAAKVRIQPEDVLTGWLPVLSSWIGNGWGLFAPPTPGDQVLVIFQEDDQEVGLILPRLFSNKQRPLAVNSGEFWLVHQSGSFLKLTNAGQNNNPPPKVLINGAVEIDMTATTINISVIQQGNSQLTPTINLTATGGPINITADGAVTVKGSTINLNPS